MAGVGLILNGALVEDLDACSDLLDYVSVIPERFFEDRGPGTTRRYRDLPDEIAALERIAAEHPLVAHGIGLSIASAASFDEEHVEALARWRRRFGFLWTSEHLSAARVAQRGAVDHHAGLALPIPFDEDVLQMLVRRVSAVQRALGEPLLLENGVTHTPVPDCDMSEARFLERLCRESGCKVLLDLHNLYVNVRNLHVDVERYFDELDLAHVREIHVAGGNELCGVYLDSHAGAVPEPVWELAERVVPRCPNLRGITFEFHESYWPGLGIDGVREQLTRARWIARKEHVTCPSPSSSAPSPT